MFCFDLLLPTSVPPLPGLCRTEGHSSVKLPCSSVRGLFHILAWVWFWVPGSVPPARVSVPPPAPHWLDTHSSTVNLHDGSSESPSCWSYWNRGDSSASRVFPLTGVRIGSFRPATLKGILISFRINSLSLRVKGSHFPKEKKRISFYSQVVKQISCSVLQQRRM